MTLPPWQRYLAKRAATGPWRLEGEPGRGFNGAVVIPALAETASLPHTLASLAANPPEQLARWLVVIVVNHRADVDPAAQADNRHTLAMLAAADQRWPGLAAGLGRRRLAGTGTTGRRGGGAGPQARLRPGPGAPRLG